MVAAEGLDEEVEDTASLLATGGDDGEHPLDEPTAPLAVGPVTRLPPAHRVANRTLRRVVRRLHTTASGECPQARLDRQEFPAHRRRLRARAHGPAFQKNADFLLQPRSVGPLEPPPGPRPISHTLPVDAQHTWRRFPLTCVYTGNRSVVSTPGFGPTRSSNATRLRFGRIRNTVRRFVTATHSHALVWPCFHPVSSTFASSPLA